ncbi:hypothetical protein [Streptomyces sp. NBC_01546]|uniref:hypothetical protein n=1 Tax=Streptomyces sp. NBC_01546 TaxID=2975872 RepID=UPI0038689B15
MLHASECRGPQAFTGQRVIVVGAGNTAVQIAVELASAAGATLAGRTPREVRSPAHPRPRHALLTRPLSRGRRPRRALPVHSADPAGLRHRPISSRGRRRRPGPPPLSVADGHGRPLHRDGSPPGLRPPQVRCPWLPSSTCVNIDACRM